MSWLDIAAQSARPLMRDFGLLVTGAVDHVSAGFVPRGTELGINPAGDFLFGPTAALVLNRVTPGVRTTVWQDITELSRLGTHPLGELDTFSCERVTALQLQAGQVFGLRLTLAWDAGHQSLEAGVSIALLTPHNPATMQALELSLTRRVDPRSEVIIYGGDHRRASLKFRNAQPPKDSSDNRTVVCNRTSVGLGVFHVAKGAPSESALSIETHLPEFQATLDGYHRTILGPLTEIT